MSTFYLLSSSLIEFSKTTPSESISSSTRLGPRVAYRSGGSGSGQGRVQFLGVRVNPTLPYQPAGFFAGLSKHIYICSNA